MLLNGEDRAAPAFLTDNEAALFANSKAYSKLIPSEIPVAKAPLNTSPAPTVSITSSFNLNDVDVISTCSVDVGPMVVVPANWATPAPLCVIVKPLESTTAKLLESSKILTPDPGVILTTSSVLVTLYIQYIKY